jgi:hypothetical protein
MQTAMSYMKDSNPSPTIKIIRGKEEYQEDYQQ